MARNRGRAQIGLVVLGLAMSGCYAATRTTIRMVEADQKLTEAREAGAPNQALYAWTKADEYLKKARDEWGRSEFESAERLLVKSMEWSAEATRLARAIGPVQELEALPDQLPVDPQRTEQEELEAEAEAEEEEEGGW